MGDGEDKRKRRAATIPSPPLVYFRQVPRGGRAPHGGVRRRRGRGRVGQAVRGLARGELRYLPPFNCCFFVDLSFVDGVDSWFTLADTTFVSRSHPSAEHITAATDVHTPYAGAIVVGMCPRLTGQAPSQTPELSFS